MKEELQKSMSSFGFQVGAATVQALRMQAPCPDVPACQPPPTPPATVCFVQITKLNLAIWPSQIINVLVTDIEPAAKVKAAMNEVG